MSLGGLSDATKARIARAVRLVENLPAAQREPVVRMFGGGSAWRWAKVRAVATNDFTADLLNPDGSLPSPLPEPLIVKVYGLDENGEPSTELELDQCIPHIAPDQIVRIVRHGAAGSGYPDGWWNQDLFFWTCAP